MRMLEVKYGGIEWYESTQSTFRRNLWHYFEKLYSYLKLNMDKTMYQRTIIILKVLKTWETEFEVVLNQEMSKETEVIQKQWPENGTKVHAQENVTFEDAGDGEVDTEDNILTGRD